MEGKDYPTRSKSGVRKIRTPWDNSSNLLFDELVGVKGSPQTLLTRDKRGHTPCPKDVGKKMSSKSPAGSKNQNTSKDKKVRKCSLPHPREAVRATPIMKYAMLHCSKNVSIML